MKGRRYLTGLPDRLRLFGDEGIRGGIRVWCVVGSVFEPAPWMVERSGPSRPRRIDIRFAPSDRLDYEKSAENMPWDASVVLPQRTELGFAAC